ncbi:hypothetical protein EG344_10990 [Chryseobacterium sp. G0162]|uniref:hypothetical protein n=1 Tax=Chryseobacterium sp. G0162 TaxID=2487063 RepID=UPI000F4EB853|nr:hypothetical protein [Chryseobacterium sp. G0162]AZB09309.1 hypothetical protein EG344_10990 [Chryseobacterium sp. G0162]
MNKDQIQREDLKKNMMKNIIFRVYYQGILDSEDIIRGFYERFKEYFKSFETTFYNRLELDFNNIDDLIDTLLIPRTEIQSQEIFRFTENTFGTDKLTFDINKYFSSLTIECTDYINIDPYLNFFTNYLEFLYSENEFLKIKKIALRKLGGNIYFDIKSIYDDFEPNLFKSGFKDHGYHSIQNRYEDTLQSGSDEPIINIIRSFEYGAYKNEKSEDIPAFQILLDLEGYYPEYILNKINFDKTQVETILKNINHNHLFNIFKLSVTENYLKNHSQNE